MKHLNTISDRGFMLSAGSSSDETDNMRRISDFDVACLRAGVTGQPVARQVYNII